MSVELVIGRLVLDGVPADVARQPALRAALEAELGRLLGAGPPALLRSGGLVGSVRGVMEPPASGTAADWGAAVARAVYGGIGG